MSDQAVAPDPPDLTRTVFEAVTEKAQQPLRPMIILGLLAGIYVGLGGLFATVALAGAEDMPFGAGQVLAGVVFSLGLALVLIAGSELFTGNTLMLGPVTAGQLPGGTAARALSVVYLANFAGSLCLAVLVLLAGVHQGGDGAVGRAALDLGVTKTDKSFVALLASGVLANMLVCLAVWMAHAGHTVTQKIAGLMLPIAAFVAAGLEHSVANMYLLPYAYMLQFVMDQPAVIGLGGVLRNIVAATLGNLIGGGFVAIAYGAVHIKR
ncbi:formate/nitrite transporter family protein [Paracoccus hibiscisoli]|nr:formate/nitrite transporter family protein [Paracoccus hibiscisoli]